LVDDLRNVNNGACMLLGATLDSIRAASIMKNLRTLHVRMKHHSQNAQFLAERFEAMGLRVVYPGLKSHPHHQLFQKQTAEKYGFGGMLTLDVGDLEKANELMERMQHEKLGYLAVSLGFYKTLFSAPGTSTSSEISEAEQTELGITSGLIRFSIGLDCNIKRTFDKMKACMKAVGVI
jgi:methionine-gamma-lyase